MKKLTHMSHLILNNRIDAGKELASKLTPYMHLHPLVLALPRGGVPVAYEVASELDAPLDTVVARKIGLPFNPEYAIGALAPGEVVEFNQNALEAFGLKKDVLAPVIKRETEEMERRRIMYKSGEYSKNMDADTVIIVDDGLATGYTARAAIESVKILRHPKKIIFAAPVCARDSAEAIRDIVDDVVCTLEVDDLNAIGYWYKNFNQTTDDEVIHYLEERNAEV